MADNIKPAAELSLAEAIAEARRCLNCAKPLCRGGCPIENEIPAFIRELANGNIGAASRLIAARSNLPAICGRVCPHEKQCEGACILARRGEGIRIGELERFIADMDNDLQLTENVAATKTRARVAVIGSGPAGLTIAGDLSKKGYAVTVFDSQSEAGGILMFGIPAFRLSKEVVRREVKKIERLGVEFRLNTMVGEDLTLDDIFADGFEAVFIGTGNSLAKRLGIAGEELPGIVDAAYFLRMVALVNKGSVDRGEIPLAPSDRVIVIGAGNVAMDAARTALRLQAASVRVLIRDAESRIAALPSEVAAAKAEGVVFTEFRAPRRFSGTVWVTGVECEINSFADGRLQGTGELEFFPANKIIVAIGQKPAARIISTSRGIAVDEGGFVITMEQPYGMTTRQGVFSGGDVVHGPATVVQAMKEAKKIAGGIDQYIAAKHLMLRCGLKVDEK